MDNALLNDTKTLIIKTVGDVAPNPLPTDYPLVGGLLDSLAVTNLIVAIEEHFGFIFNDEELSAEAFQDAKSLAALISAKIGA